MIDIHAHLDREEDAGTFMIRATDVSVTELCTDIELIVAHIVKGLAKQMPADPNTCCQVALMFSIAAANGAKRGLIECKEEM